MKNIYLHIGAEKTGSTSIQEFLALNRDLLIEKSYIYPYSPGNTNHINLSAYAMRDGHFDSIRKSLNIFDQETLSLFRENFKNNLLKEINEANCNNIILSNEHCHSRLRSQSEIESLRQLLTNISDNINIIFYIRRQDKMAVSLYSTALKVGETREFDFNNMADDYYFNFNAVYDNWISVFGKENISVRIFDNSELINGDLIEDFCCTVNLDLVDKLVRPQRKNEGFTADSVTFVRELNKRMPSKLNGFPNQKKDYLIKLISNRFPGRGVMPSHQAAIEFYNKYRESNEKLRLSALPEKESLFDEDFDIYNESVNASSANKNKYDVPIYLIRQIISELFDLKFETLIREANTAINNKNYKGARKLLWQALSFKRESAEANYKYAYVCRELGLTLESKKHIDIALSVQPEFDKYIVFKNELTATLEDS